MGLTYTKQSFVAHPSVLYFYLLNQSTATLGKSWPPSRDTRSAQGAVLRQAALARRPNRSQRGRSNSRPAQAALAAPRAAEPREPALPRPAPPRPAQTVPPRGGQAGPSVGLCGVAPFPPTQCTQARPDTRSPCRLRRRGVFSTEPGAGPWTRFPQVLPVPLPGEGMTAGLRNLSHGEPAVPVCAPPAGRASGLHSEAGDYNKVPTARPQGAVQRRQCA